MKDNNISKLTNELQSMEQIPSLRQLFTYYQMKFLQIHVMQFLIKWAK